MQKILSDILTGLNIISQKGNADPVISEIIFDSRKAGGDTVFVAQKGTQADGHDYISSVFEAGCKAVVCEVMPENIPEDAVCVKVENSSETLGLMASAFYDYPSSSLKLVGVTGTNGKTTIATLLYELTRLLGHKAGLFSTVTNFIDNEQIAATHTTPDAVTLNKIMKEMVDKGCSYCFMEVSSHAIHQKRIAGLNFAGGIFTNITHDHLDYHKTFKAYIKAKKAFFDNLDKDAFALVNADDKNGMVMVQNTKASVYTYSVREIADFKARIIENMFEGMQLNIDGHEVWSPFVGYFNAQNLLAVYGTTVLLGHNKEDVLVQLSKLKPVDGRFETIRSDEGITAVVDYAHTPDALKNVIDTINSIRSFDRQLITVVGAGGDRDKTKRPLMAAEAVKGSSKVILTSDNPRSEDPEQIIKEMMEGVTFKEKIKVISITNREEAIKTAYMVARPGDIILIAGKGHETYQEVKGVRHHFDDREIIKEIFAQK
jgi:UDP-N-acetylmuramoyl-L-alanyl-D-glutamate--2,6-diaminopimelate ligase